MGTASKSWGIVAVGLFLLTIVSIAHAKYSGGTGASNDPYQIATAADLIALGETPEDYDKHFILTADIDLDPNLPGRKVFDKAVIAPDTNRRDEWSQFQGTLFTGVFDGNGHTISHLRVVGDGFLGLFGQLGSGAEVRSLGVADVNVTCSGDYVGGLVGFNGGAVTNCYSTGSASAHLIGSDGLIGRAFAQDVANGVTGCFWDIQTSGQTTSVGGIGKTTAEMQTAKTFLDAGWDFVGETKNGTEDIWWILEGKDYPRLWWEAAKK